MALDGRKYAYRPERRFTRTGTSYGAMNKWLYLDLYGNEDQTFDDREMDVFQERQKSSRTPSQMSDVSYLKKDPREMLNYFSESYQRGESDEYQHTPAHLQYPPKSCGYDDFHRAFLHFSKMRLPPRSSFPHFGPPRLRQGNGGSSWRHVKLPLQSNGKRLIFVDGQVSVDDKLLSRGIPRGDLIMPNLKQKIVPEVPHPKRSPGRGRTPVHTSAHGLNSKWGVEHNNWLIMR